MAKEREGASPENVARRRLVLPELAMQHIRNHKYQSGVYSFLDHFLKRRLWLPCGESLPLWLAPNVITISGLSIMACSALHVAWYCPTMTEEPPRLACILAGLGLFLYQTLDAMDGIQARRTGSSSPLGQLVDHGCDALVVTFQTLMLCCICKSGFQLGFCLLTMSHTIYFLAQWEEYHTGVLRTGTEYFGNTELQCVAYMFCILCGLIGPWIVDMSVVSGIKNADLFAGFVIGFCVISFIAMTTTVMTVCKSRTHALRQLIPFFFSASMVFVWSFLPTVAHPHFLYLSLGFSLSYLECWMIFSSFAELKYSMKFCKIAFPVPILVVMLTFDVFRDYEKMVCGAHLMYVTSTLFRFLRQAGEELCSILDVNFWTIPPPKNA